MNTIYGQELVLDLHGCDASLFNRKDLDKFFTRLCDLIGVEKGDRYWWDDVGVPEEECQTDPDLKGTSAVQFILTSTIVVHVLDLLGTVYVNIFSCGEFSAADVEAFCIDWFKAHKCHSTVVARTRAR